MTSFTNMHRIQDESMGAPAEDEQRNDERSSASRSGRRLGLRVASLGLGATLVGATVLAGAALPAGAATRLTPTRSTMPVRGSQPDAAIPPTSGASGRGFNPNGGGGNYQPPGSGGDRMPQTPSDGYDGPAYQTPPEFQPNYGLPSNQPSQGNQTGASAAEAAAAAAAGALWQYFETVVVPALPDLLPALIFSGGTGASTGVIPGYGGSGGNCEATAASGGVRALMMMTCND